MNFEFIVVDGSDNNYVDVALKAFPNCKYIKSEARGIYNAMNIGANIASSDYIWFLNAGDILVHNNSFEYAVNELLGLNFPSVLFSTVLNVTPGGHLFGLTVPVIEKRNGTFMASVNHQGCLMKKDVFLKLGGFDENLVMAADSKLLDSALLNANCVQSRSIFASFELGGRSSTNISQTLSELNALRPKSIGISRRLAIVIKTRTRNYLFSSPRFLLLKILVKFYLEKRGLRVKKYLKKHGWEEIASRY
jgi:glycosyltransferase involved in cell wall biosynthesis